jgi:pimeloyl-ACP methyl ester carboxylesterase
VTATRQSVRRALAARRGDELHDPVLWVGGERVGPSLDSEEVVFKGTGHFVQLERPEELADMIHSPRPRRPPPRCRR